MAKEKSSIRKGKKRACPGVPERKSVHTDETAMASSAFLKVLRELSYEELSSPGVVRIMLDKVEQSEHRKAELSELRERLHKTDMQMAVLEERMRKSGASEIMSWLAPTIGAVLIGLTPFFWVAKPQGPISLALGVVLLVSGVMSRVLVK